MHAHIPLEYLATGLQELERRFRLPHINVQNLSDSFHHNTPTSHCNWPEAAATVPADLETLEALGTPTAEAFLDPKTLESVHQVYRADYDAYSSFYPVKHAIRARSIAA